MSRDTLPVETNFSKPFHILSFPRVVSKKVRKNRLKILGYLESFDENANRGRVLTRVPVDKDRDKSVMESLRNSMDPDGDHDGSIGKIDDWDD